jgi:O-succinylbenzoic acid--CoA ligase
MKPLRVVASGDDVLAALRDALAGGPALFVDAGGAADLPETVEQRIALVVETSGSSSRPKRVALGADAVLASAAASESALGGPGQWVMALPDHYIAGINVLTRSLAADTVPVGMTGAHFSAAAFVDAARSLGIPERFTALVPAQLAILLDDADARSALRDFAAVLVGGQSTPRPLLESAAEHGIRVVRSYGSSETSGGCVYDGAPIGQTTVRVEDGEVWLGGPTLAEGYLGEPELSAERFVVADGAHWFRTADAGTWDGERLSVTGRRDDVIVSGGVKVSLGAVERVLREQPGFPDAVVVAADDERWGQVPVAFTTSAADAADAIAAVAAALGAPARPARVIRIDALPLLPSGKPDRTALAARPAD